MKTLQLISRKTYIIILLAMITGCSNNVKEQTSKEILNDMQKQEEIMITISNNHEMMTNMMEYMMKSEHAMQMMEGNQVMMNHLMDGEHMMGNIMQMMSTDSIMCRNMQQMMMNNEHMNKVMMEMSNRHGMGNGKVMMEGHMHKNNHKTDN